MQYAIFVERIFDDECFEKLKEFCANHIKGSFWQDMKTSYPPILHPENVRLFCLTPVNYELVVAEQGYTGSKEQLSKIMAKRYRELSWMGCQIDLHLHLGLRLENINQEKMMKEAMNWMKKNDFNPEFVTYGWYIHNSESRKVEKKFKTKFFNDKHCYSYHDYEYDSIYSPMMILQNIRGMLR